MKNRIMLSSLAAMAVAGASSAQMFDVNDDDDANSVTQSGWTAADATNINNVTFTAVGNGQNSAVVIEDRDRGTNNGGGAEADMWRDFIFAHQSDTVGTTGMDVTVSGLLANTAYNVTIWAYDELSDQPVRNAIWTGSNGGTSANYSFDGGTAGGGLGTDPTSLADYRADFTAITDGSGTLVLEGRTGAGGNLTPGQPNVFMNGFELTVIPEPGSLALLGLGGLALLRRRRA